MKNILHILLATLLILTTINLAQGAAINSSGTEADASAILDVSSTAQGILVPRMTESEREAISSPATGLLVFQTDGTVGFYYYTGGYWSRLNNESSIAVLTTTSASSITETTAESGGNITSNGGETITARGVCWSTSSNPTISSDTTNDGTGTGNFTSTISGLTGGAITYYVRAYATNSKGTSYGNQISFETSALAPTLSTNSISNISSSAATSGGNISSNGGASITARGVCWSTSSNPTISNDTTYDGTGSGSFTSSITGLTALTTYYVRAYATNSVGTSYGDETNFTTGPASVGDSFGGGIVFYVNGNNGLIAAESDQSSGADWNTAVSICNNLVLNGYDDWYLPSSDELLDLYNERNTVGGFSSGNYWSSSGSGSNRSFVAFSGIRAGQVGSNALRFEYKVRAIRAF